MDITKELDNAILPDLLTDISDTDAVFNFENEVDVIVERLKEGICYLARKFNDGSVIYYKVTLQSNLLREKALDSSGMYLYDYDSRKELSWDILKKTEIVSEEYINSLPLLDRVLNGGVK